MNLNKNECAMFPVQQIISTSIGAICTALLMVEKKNKEYISITINYFFFSRHHLMLLEFDYNHNNIDSLKVIVMFFVLELLIMFVHVLMDMNQFHGIIDQYLENIMEQLMLY